MSTQELIDTQFDRAVEIVQSLPKTGPIQTQYDEKLNMYALYKQATVGNVQGPRPSMLHMLHRAKWDAWAQNKDLDRLEAKWLYVDALLKVLRKYSDRTVARSLVEELESYSGDPGNLVMSRSFSQSRASGSTNSTNSGHGQSGAFPQSEGLPISSSAQWGQPPDTPSSEASTTDDEEDHEAGSLPEMVASPQNRPPSSLSSHRYRTPMAGSLAMSPPLRAIPASQPLPTFDTPSAFADQRASSTPGVSYSQQPHSPRSYGELYRGEAQGGYPGSTGHPAYRPSPLPQPYGQGRPPSRLSLEHAVENVQAHLAALTERLDSLQSSMSYQPIPSQLSRTGSRVFVPRRRSPEGDASVYDLGDLGLWSYVVQPVSRGLDFLREVTSFLIKDENRTPTMVIVRRLCLDVSFLVCVLAVVRAIWRGSGPRRREVKSALAILWKAVLGRKERSMLDKGV